MTKGEKRVIIEALEEHNNVMQHYFKLGKETGDWTEHKIACAGYRAVKEIAEAFGIKEGDR